MYIKEILSTQKQTLICYESYILGTLKYYGADNVCSPDGIIYLWFHKTVPFCRLFIKEQIYWDLITNAYRHLEAATLPRIETISGKHYMAPT